MSERWKHARGFSVVELMVVTAISGFILLGVLSTNLHLLRSGTRITQYSEMEAQVRRALEQLGRDLKTASGIKWNGPSDITLTLPTVAGGTTQMTYAWTASSQTFYAVAGADSTVTTGRIVLLREIPSAPGGGAAVTFARFDRDGNAATADLATKSVQVNIAIRRQSSSAAVASQDMASALFTLRNKATS